MFSKTNYNGKNSKLDSIILRSLNMGYNIKVVIKY